MRDSPLRVLLIEDSEDDAELVLRELQRDGLEVSHERVSRRDAMTEALDRGGWDVIISDYHLPGFGGLDALDIVKERGLDVPFILVSGAIGEETAVGAMKAGAHDYVMKDRLARLAPAVRRELEESAGRRERRRAEARLRESLEEKETLLKEIHHRVKNNLQIVYSLLNLQARQVHDWKTMEGLQDCRNRVKAMALVHEKLYQSEDLARIDFADYVRDLARNLFDAFGARERPILLKVGGDSVPFGIDVAVPCGLIAYELMSNSLKHAFPGGRGGEISVSLSRQEGGRLKLRVKDDGVGFPEGFKFHEAQSLGLRLVANLASQLDGTLSVDKEKGAGFTLVFPVPDNALKSKKKEAVS